MEALWFIVVVGGPVVLFLAIIYGVLQFKRRSRSMDGVSDRGARELRRKLDRDGA
jgi:hypothetical protein